MATNIRSISVGLILIQTGNGVPTHISTIGTIYIDLNTATEYINKDGVSNWVTNGTSGLNLTQDQYNAITGATSPSASNHFVTFQDLIGVTGSTSSFTGGTVSGATNFTGGLTANTISATTYYGLPKDIYVTGGTYSNGSAIFTNNTGGTFTLSGFYTGNTDIHTTAFTNSNNTFIITDNTNTSYSTILNTLTGLTVNGSLSANTLSATTLYVNNVQITGDTYVTGLTFTPSNYNLTLYQNHGPSLIANIGIIGIDVTGGTYNSSSGCVTFVTNSGGTFTVCGFLTGYTNTYVSGFTYTPSSNQIQIFQTQNDPTLSINITQMSGLTITNGLTATTISATTYQNLPISVNTYTTGFTNSNNIFSIKDNSGNTYSTILSTLTGLTVNGSLSATTISGSTEYINRTLINASTNNLTNPERLLVNDGGTGGTGYSNTIVGIASVNNYAQLNIQNTYSGNNASSDVVATSDNGNESINYIDMGINSSTFNQNYVGGANDAYVYSTGNNLYLGNVSTGKTVNIFVGGSNVAATGNTTTVFSTGNTTSYVPFYTPTISATTYLNLNTNAWSPQGNSGLTAGTYFLGTKDNNGLMFKTNNQQSGYIDITTNNTSFGVGTLTAITSANTYNVAIGYQALQSVSSNTATYGVGNVAVGYQALQNNIVGYSNVAIGYQALQAMNNSSLSSVNSGQIAIGANAMSAAQPGTRNNVGIGYAALTKTTAAAPSVAIGWSSLNNLTTGQHNTAIGYNTLNTSQADSYNIAIGDSALSSLNGGSYNTAIGEGAGYTSTNGQYNTYLGYAANYYATTASYNTHIGSNNFGGGGQNNITGNYNTSLGYNVAYVSTGLTNTINIGYAASAITSNTIQLGNASITGLTIGTGSLQTIAQSPNLYINSSGQVYQSSLNLANTYWSLLGNSGSTPGTNFIGTTDAKALIFKTNNQTSGILDPIGYNVGFGTGSLTGYTSASTYNVGIGYNALPITSGGTYNVALGVNALAINTTGSFNIAIGYNALKSFAPTSDGNNIAIGYGALSSWAQTTSNGNTKGAVAIGYNSQAAANSAIANTSVGYNSMASLTGGQLNAAFGRNAMVNYNAYYGSAFGAGALGAAAGNFNSAFGYNSGGNTTGTGNSFFGSTTGSQNTSGSYNTFIGAPIAGVNPNNVTGSYNTTLGYGADMASSALTNSTSIGYSALVSTSNSIQLGNPSVTGLTIGNGGLNTTSNSPNLYYNTSTGLVSVSTASSSSSSVGQIYLNPGQILTMQSFGGGATYQDYWYVLTGATNQGVLMRGFSANTSIGNLTYTGTSGNYFEVEYFAVVKPIGANSFYTGLMKNVTNTSPSGNPSINFPSSGGTNGWSANTISGATLLLDSIQFWQAVTTANEGWPVAGKSIVQLNNGDVIQFGYAMVETSTQQATALNLNLTIKQII